MPSERGAQQQDLIATVSTIVVHALVGIFLLLNLSLSNTSHQESVEAEAIPAEVVDEVAIREELEQLAEQERQRQRAEAERQAQLAQAAREVEERRQAESRRQREEGRIHARLLSIDDERRRNCGQGQSP